MPDVILYIQGSFRRQYQRQSDGKGILTFCQHIKSGQIGVVIKHGLQLLPQSGVSGIFNGV